MNTPNGFSRERWSGKARRVLEADCGLCNAHTYTENVQSLRQRDGWTRSRRWGWLCPAHRTDKETAP